MILPGNFGDSDEWAAPNWASIDKHLVEVHHYRLHECPELTLPDMVTLFSKQGSTVAEPDWFVTGVRKAESIAEKLRLLQRFMRS